MAGHRHTLVAIPMIALAALVNSGCDDPTVTRPSQVPSVTASTVPTSVSTASRENPGAAPLAPTIEIPGVESQPVNSDEIVTVPPEVSAVQEPTEEPPTTSPEPEPEQPR
jgi:hypothetical protein